MYILVVVEFSPLNGLLTSDWQPADANYYLMGEASTLPSSSSIWDWSGLHTFFDMFE